MSRPSLARRLLATSLVGLALLLLAGGAALSYAFRRAAESAFDAHLEAWQRALVASLRIEPDGRLAVEAALGDPRFEQIFSGWYWQVTSQDGATLAASLSLWDTTLAAPAGAAPPDAAEAARSLAGPREQALRGLVRRVTPEGGSAPVQLIVAGDERELRREIDRFDTLLLAALGALGLGILCLTALQMRMALGPLRSLTQEIAAVRAGARERVGPDAPRELVPLVESLNALLAHDQERVQAARTHAADLAHALKTPLSLVLAEAEELGDERGRRIARHALGMRRHIEFRLSMAVARSAVASTLIPARPVIEAIADTLERLHPRVAIERHFHGDAAFAGAREDLEEIAGNLLENACKWAKGCARVTAHALDERRLSLVFEDDGPGLDEAECETVLARGVRLDEQAPGSGLGLAIVSDLVLLYGGALQLDRSPLGGLRVGVELALRRSPS